MSHLGSVSCVTCQARNKKYDGTRGLNGCRRCVKVGLECSWPTATSSRIPRPKHNVRESQQARTQIDYPEHPESNEAPYDMRSSASLSNLDNASRSAGESFAVPAAPNDNLDWPTDVPGVQQYTGSYTEYPGTHGPPPVAYNSTSAEHYPIASTSQIATSSIQLPTPPMHDSLGLRAYPTRQMVVPSQANLTRSISSRTWSDPIAPLTPQSPESRLGVARGLGSSNIRNQGPGLDSQQEPTAHLQSYAEPAVQWPASVLDNEPEPEDIENIETELLQGLPLDRQVESNMLPFIVHCFAAWMTRFVFEPTRVLPVIVNHIRRGYSFGDETRQTMMMVSNSALDIAKTTDYDLTNFQSLYKVLVDRVVDARSLKNAELTKDLALATMEHSHQLISTLFKVGSLANVLYLMDLYAPIFRRACPEPSEGLVNLPRRLTAMEVQLKYYSALDVIQSFVTHRPMFFRYDLEFLSPKEEMFIKSGSGPGLKWLYGVPDRLMVVIARMNTLFEEFGSGVDPETVEDLEQEIAACGPSVSTNTGTSPSLDSLNTERYLGWSVSLPTFLVHSFRLAAVVSIDLVS